MLGVDLLRVHRPDDLTILAEWLKQPRVAAWWGDAETALAEIKAHAEWSEAMIQAEGKPVGYLCWQKLTAEERLAAGLEDLPIDLVDIDIMIGDPEFEGRGVGPEALRQLLVRLQGEGVDHAGLATAVANARALKAFKKVGFQLYREFVEADRRMIYLIRNLNTGL